MKDNLLGPFQQELRKVFPHAIVSDDVTSDHSVQEARVTGVSVQNIQELMSKQNQHLEFRVENGELIARYSPTKFIHQNNGKQIQLLLLLWLISMIITFTYMYVMTDEYRSFLAGMNSNQSDDESNYFSIFSHLISGV